MFLAHVKLVVHHDPQVFFSKAAFQLASHQPVLVPGIIPSQVQDLVFPSIKCHETHFSTLPRSLWMAAHPSVSDKVISLTSQCIMYKLAEDALCFVI